MEEPKTRKGGRPPKADREKKSCRIDLKLNQADFDQLEKHYLHSGYRSKSDMYRDMLLNKTLRQKDGATLEMLREIQVLAREIKAIGADYRKISAQLEEHIAAGKVSGEVQKLVSLTLGLREKEQEMFQVIVKLREKWLRE